ncbi:flagellar motor protein MotB [Pseudoxanthomonas kalamensis DSM 18571]|uniref:OmpA family protein n=1 Tax=Pseudoxanthomonas kalamensis TaxID=289483 RepID=UPI00139073D6|nr:OmpA family protein [Pseudoxanthomonas kalamensis]KAF1712353.1 flagellar motor protein MotB [Pseudoxanthomonas kalamensis DSM 18571]
MNKKTQTSRVWLALVAIPLLVAAGCTRHVSRDISADGKAGEVIFPEIKPGGWMQEGTFPTPDSLRQIIPGMSKDQLYALLGAPHFREGYYGVREWDYIFNFPIGTDGAYRTCQYKIIFDEDFLARSFHWKDPECRQWVQAGERSTAPRQVVNLSADALFSFNGASKDDITNDGRDQIAELGEKLGKDVTVQHVLVTGHTDRIGSDAANLALSQRRAETVRWLLLEAGVPADRISAVGAGETQPVKECPTITDRQAEIACLQPNRRVEVAIWGEGDSPDSM